MVQVFQQRLPIALLTDPDGSTDTFQLGALATDDPLPLARQVPLVLDVSTPVGVAVARRVIRTPGALPFYVLGNDPELEDESCGRLGPGLSDPYDVADDDLVGLVLARLVRLAHIWHCVGGAITGDGDLLNVTANLLHKPVLPLTHLTEST